MASQIACVSIVCSNGCSGIDPKDRSSAPLASVRETTGGQWFPSQKASNAEMFPFNEVTITFHALPCPYNTLLAKKVVTPPLNTIKPMWIELLCFHLAEIGMIWTRDCSPTKSDTTLGRHSMQGQVGSSSSETTV